ncbi:unnamed protein product, partial [Meganyctiphanes norvegica]
MDQGATWNDFFFFIHDIRSIEKFDIKMLIISPPFTIGDVETLCNFVAESYNVKIHISKKSKKSAYLITCVIMQKNGAGLHTASSCYWDNTTDGSCTVRWENKTMYCIVSVFGLSIN